MANEVAARYEDDVSYEEDMSYDEVPYEGDVSYDVAGSDEAVEAGDSSYPESAATGSGSEYNG
ncbi:MAG TPA: hypothetical protein VF163_07615 [Micromonosporaceae bacterium]